MTENVEFTLHRADSSKNEDLTKLARHGADTFGFKATLTVDRKMAQLLRLRVSQMNNCSFCLKTHFEASRSAEIADVEIATLSTWRETDLHDEATRAALAYTEAMTALSDPAVAASFGAAHDELAKHFNEAEILEIAAVVINMNIWTRLKMAEGAKPRLA